MVKGITETPLLATASGSTGIAWVEFASAGVNVAADAIAGTVVCAFTPDCAIPKPMTAPTASPAVLAPALDVALATADVARAATWEVDRAPVTRGLVGTCPMCVRGTGKLAPPKVPKLERPMIPPAMGELSCMPRLGRGLRCCGTHLQPLLWHRPHG